MRDMGKIRAVFRKYAPVLVWAALIGLHAAAWLQQASAQRYWLEDSREYAWAARNFEEQGEWYSAPWESPLRPERFSKRPPGYPAFLLLLGMNPLLISAVQNLLSLFNLWGAWLLARRLLGRPPAPALFGLLALSWAQLIYPQLLMTEMLFQSCLWLCAWACLRSLAAGGGRWLGLAGLLIGLGVWVKPVMYPFIGAWLLWLGWRAWQQRSFRPLAWLLIPLLLTGALVWRNYEKTGYAHVSSIQQLSLLQYTTYFTRVRAAGEAQARAETDQIEARYRSLPFAEGMREINRACTALLWQTPALYARLHAEGMLRFFLDPGRFDLFHFLGQHPEASEGLLSRYSRSGYGGIWAYLREQGGGIIVLLGIALILNALRLGLFLLWLLRGGSPWPVRLLVGAVPLGLAFLTGLSGASRFALPAFPLLLAGALAGAALLRGKVISRK
jgi:4-amino-4-deoxy-L-arabinose transferase-like glycosyltransferase